MPANRASRPLGPRSGAAPAGARRTAARARWASSARRPFVLLAVLGLGCLALSSCGSGAPSSSHATGTGTPSASNPARGAGNAEQKTTAGAAPTTGSPTTAPPTTTTTTTTTVPPQPGWTVLASDAAGVVADARTVVVPDGSSIRVVRFRAGQVRYDLHVGSEDPPTGSAALPPDAQPSIAPTEAPALVGAFNGGFRTTTGSGGAEVDGQVLTPLLPGMASLVIDASGAASIGVWGAPGFPSAGTQVASVRQNLPPLVLGGAPTSRASAWTAWGATLGGGADVARSALGEDAAGNLLYAASMSTVPIDLADALVTAGAVVAMELDINPEWVQADVAPTPGTPPVAEVPGQVRPSDQYEAGWIRDFVAVLATSP